MPTVKVVRAALIIFTSVYVGMLIAFVAYSVAYNLFSGSESLVRAYLTNLTGLIVWAGTALLIGKFIEEKTEKKK